MTCLRHHRSAKDALHPEPLPFAGWYLPGIARLAMFLSCPVQTSGVSVFVGPMLDETGWLRSAFFAIYSIGTLTSAVVLIAIWRRWDSSWSVCRRRWEVYPAIS
jgi:hypothetical protein